jgi:hypothetical protein
MNASLAYDRDVPGTCHPDIHPRRLASNPACMAIEQNRASSAGVNCLFTYCSGVPYASSWIVFPPLPPPSDVEGGSTAGAAVVGSECWQLGSPRSGAFGSQLPPPSRQAISSACCGRATEVVRPPSARNHVILKPATGTSAAPSAARERHESRFSHPADSTGGM